VNRTHRGNLPWQASKLAYTVEEAAELLSLSRAHVYRLIELGDLQSVKIGKCRRVTCAQLEAYVSSVEQNHGFIRLA
jgi:excisionase family DNA binding protein